MFLVVQKDETDNQGVRWTPLTISTTTLALSTTRLFFPNKGFAFSLGAVHPPDTLCARCQLSFYLWESQSTDRDVDHEQAQSLLFSKQGRVLMHGLQATWNGWHNRPHIHYLLMPLDRLEQDQLSQS